MRSTKDLEEVRGDSTSLLEKQAWNYTDAKTRAMASVAPGLGLGAPLKVSHRLSKESFLLKLMKFQAWRNHRVFKDLLKEHVEHRTSWSIKSVRNRLS